MAFAQHEFKPGQRVYTNNSFVQLDGAGAGGRGGGGQGGGGGGFGGGPLGEIAGGFAGLANAAGVVKNLFDSWGAAGRAEEDKRNIDGRSLLAQVHPDTQNSWDPETRAGIAQRLGWSPEQLDSEIALSSSQWTPDREKMDAALDLKNEMGGGGIDEFAQTQEGQIPEDAAPQEGAPLDGGGLDGQPQTEPVVGEGTPSALNPEYVVQNYETSMEMVGAPTTYADYLLEIQTAKTPVPKIQPDVEGAQQVGMQASRDFTDYLKSQKVYGAILRYQLVNGQPPDPAMAEEVSMRMASKAKAFTQGLKSYGLKHFEFLPEDDLKYLQDMDYFEAGVNIAQYNSDPKFAADVKAKDPGAFERWKSKLKDMPIYLKNHLTQGVMEAAKVKMQMGITWDEQRLKQEAEDRAALTQKNTYAVDMEKAGADKVKAQADLTRAAKELNISEADLEVKKSAERREWKKLSHEQKLENINKAHERAKFRIDIQTSGQTSKLLTYKTMAEVQSVQAPNSEARLWIEIAKQYEQTLLASAKHADKARAGPMAPVAEQMEGSASATDLEGMANLNKEMEDQLKKRVGNAPFPLTLPNNAGIYMVDPTRPMLQVLSEISIASGNTEDSIGKELKYLGDLENRYNSSQGGSSISIPPKLRDIYNYAEDMGQLQQLNFENQEQFFKFIKSVDPNVRDPAGLWAYHQKRVGN